jgi:predicted ATPase
LTCFYRALLAETHQVLGETDEALRLLTGELERVSQSGELWYVAELHRRIGEVHRQCGRSEAARRSFEQALAVAREQSAKLWELQAATGYAQLLRDEGKPAEAHTLLAPVYAWFTEGFDTVPLRAARAMLDELEHARPRVAG